MRVNRRQVQGFTLVEVAIVLVIVGVLLAGVLNAQSVMRDSRVQNSIKTLTDVVEATRQFKDRYGMWPGDFSNAIASGLVCANGDGNGQIGTAVETACATDHLILAGLVRGAPGTPISVRDQVFSVTGATAALTGVAAASIPANWVNVVRIQNLDCDFAVRLDRATDDGNTNTGNFRTTAATCGAAGTDQSEDTLVANAILRLN